MMKKPTPKKPPSTPSARIAMSDKSWFPIRSGTYRAYEPRWLDGGEWRRIQTDASAPGSGSGIPAPLLHGGINYEIGLFGYDQAMALAHWFAASAASRGECVTVRVQEFDVVFEIKAREREE